MVSLVKHKKKLWKEWQQARGSKEKYLEAKRKAELAKYFAKRKFQEEKFSQQASNDIKKFVFKPAKRMNEV